MASSSICALCKQPHTDHITGKLQKMPGMDVVAHYNCMMYSPGVVSIESQEDMDGFECNIRSVLAEIKRGKKLRCSYCKKIGATVGCDVESCRKNYHFPCLIKAKGFPCKDKYIVHCELHRETDHDAEDSDGKTKKDKRTSRKRRRLQNIAGEARKKTTKNLQNNEVMPNVPIEEQPECSFLLSVQPIETEEDGEEDLPSLSSLQMCSSGSYERTGGCKSASKIKHLTCRKCETPLPDAYEYSQCSSCCPHPTPKQPIQNVVIREKDFVQSSMKEPKKRRTNQFPLSTSSDESSEESDSILAPKVKDVFSLSGFPKRKKKGSSKKKPNAELEEVLQGMSSQEKRNLSQIYSELGGSLPDPAIEMASPQENSNDTATTEDYTTTHVTDTSTMSSNDELDKTPERLPDINVHVTPPRTSIEGEHFTEGHPGSSREEEIPSKTSASSCKTENGIDRPVVSPMTTNIGNRRVAHLEASNDIRPTAQQIHSTKCEDMLSSQPTSCTDKSRRPDTSVGHPIDDSTQQQASNLEAHGTSETDSSGCPAVSEPESGIGPPLTLKKEVNKTEVPASVSDASVDNMESGLSASQHLRRDSLLLASPRNVTTSQNKEKVRNKGDISAIVSPKQIKAISEKLTTGNLNKHLKRFVPQIQSSIGSQKRSTTNGAEQRRDGEPIKNLDLVCPGISQSITLKRKLSQDFEELRPHVKLQQAEGNLSEQLEISEEQNDNNFREKATPGAEGNLSEQLEISEEQNGNNSRENVTSGPEESEHAPEHQSEPSRMTTPFRQRTEGSLSEQLEISENNSRGYSTSGSLESDRASEHQSGPSSMTTPFRRRRLGSRHRSKKRSGCQHGGFGDLHDIDGFGRAVAGQCRHLPLDRQARYMSYVFASADLFRAYPILPELNILITSLQAAFEASQTSTIHSPCGSSV